MSPTQDIIYRQAGPLDKEQIQTIDDSFTTDTVYEIVAEKETFMLRPVCVDPPLVKEFPSNEGDHLFADQHVEVAVSGDKICGFVVAGVEDWHCRLVIHQITVAPTHRGRGIGAALMERACAYGRRLGIRTAWLETSNMNAPAIRAYQRMGFTLCGLDTTFYRSTPSEGETALFMSKPLDAQ